MKIDPVFNCSTLPWAWNSERKFRSMGTHIIFGGVAKSQQNRRIKKWCVPTTHTHDAIRPPRRNQPTFAKCHTCNLLANCRKRSRVAAKNRPNILLDLNRLLRVAVFTCPPPPGVSKPCVRFPHATSVVTVSATASLSLRPSSTTSIELVSPWSPRNNVSH